MKYTDEQIRQKYLADLQKVVEQELAEDAAELASLTAEQIAKLPNPIPCSRFGEILSDNICSFDSNLVIFKFPEIWALNVQDLENFGKSEVVWCTPDVSVVDGCLCVTVLLIDEYDDGEKIDKEEKS